MDRTGLKTRAEIPIYTDKKRRAIIAQAGSRRRFFLFQRCILATFTDFIAGVLTLLLADYFPDRRFIPKNNAENLDILNYAVKKNGRWTLDIEALSRSNKKYLSSLIHEEVSLWNEKEARKKYGCADVTRFFIDVENDRFYNEFSKLENAKRANIDKDAIPEKFLQELWDKNQESKPVWEDWDFSWLVSHKPHTIYKAFCYYAHKYYTLLGFGLSKLSEENPDALQNCSAAKLLSAGNKLLDEIVTEQIPEIMNFGIECQIALLELIGEILESVPTGTSLYAPTKKDVFVRQLTSAIPGFLQNKKYGVEGGDEVNSDIYDSKERKNIKNYMDRIGQYIDDDKDNYEYLNLKESGTYRKKAEFIRRLTQKPSIRRHYSERELEIIEGFFNEKSSFISLFTPVQGKEGDESSFLIDHLDIDELGLKEAFVSHIEWAVFFEDVFKIQFDEPKMQIFLKCILDHFEHYPLEVNSAGNLKMKRYSKQMLFSTFCSVAGITVDKKLWGLFLDLIQQVIDNMNRARSQL